MRKIIFACSALCLTTQMLLAQQSILLEPIKIAEEYSIEIRQSVNDFKIVRLDLPHFPARHQSKQKSQLVCGVSFFVHLF